MTEEEKTTEVPEEIAEKEQNGAEDAPVEKSAPSEENLKTDEDGQKVDEGTDEDGQKVDEGTDEEDKAAVIKKMVEGKSLDKMTVKDLKEVAKEIPGLTGVHGMNKPDLLVEIKKFLGIEEAPKKQKDISLVEVKKTIKSLKVKREEAISANDKKMAKIYKRKISRLKKKTRRAA